MAKLIMCRGLPASGKTTYARGLVEKHGSWGRVNRDDLRAMIFNSVWSGKREGIIVEVEKAIAEVLLRNNHSVVVDDTNLTPKHKDMWSGFANSNGYGFETKTFDVPLTTCVERDKLRDTSVGKAVIHRMALNAGLIDFGDKPIILCDIDGTIADGTQREWTLKGDRKDWKTYYSLLPFDTPIDFVIRWVRELAKDHTICLVSGRPDTYQRQTIRWLQNNQVPYNYLFMRSGSNRREDFIVKAEILEKIPRHLIQFAIDDRPQVIEKCWKANGVKVYPVRGACEPF